MNTIAAIHIALEIWGAVFCVIAGTCLYIEKSLDIKENKLMIGILLSNAMLLLNDVLAWIFRGNTDTSGFYMVRISNFMVFLMTILLLLSITKYVDYVILATRKEFRCRSFIKIIYLLCMIAIALLIFSQFTHIYYDFDEQNRYFRQSLYWISLVPCVLGMIFNGMVVLLNRKNISIIQTLYLLSYIIIPTIATVIQFYIYGIQILNLSITISVMIMFFGSQIQQGKKYLEQERELSNA